MAGSRGVGHGRRAGEIGELLLVYLRELIGTWRKQLVVFGDPEWLKKQ